MISTGPARRCRGICRRPTRSNRARKRREAKRDRRRIRGRTPEGRAQCWLARLIRSTGSRDTWSAPTSLRGSSRRRNGSRACRRLTIRVAAASRGRSGTAPWRRPGAAEGFLRTKGVISEDNVIDYLVFSTENPSSIRNCIAHARSNARSIRVALTTEMWGGNQRGLVRTRALGTAEGKLRASSNGRS